MDAERFPRRGGNWNNGSNAGLGALNLNNSRSNTNSNIGFRPALEDSQKVRRSRLRIQRVTQKGVHSSARKGRNINRRR